MRQLNFNPIQSLILFLFLSFNSTISAQNKKELEDQILKLNSEVQQLNNELSNAKNKATEDQKKIDENQKKNEAYLKKVDEYRSKYEVCLEDKEKMLERQEKLVKQNEALQFKFDSLLRVKNTENTFILTNPKNMEDSMKMTLQKYWLASNVQDRFECVNQSKTTLEKMKNNYATGLRPQEIKPTEISFGNRIGEYTEVFWKDRKYYVSKVNGNYLIDWEASIGYNKPTLTMYKSDPSIKSAEFRVKAILGDYYNYNYNNKESQYICVQCSDNNEAIYGYVARNSSIGKKLLEILSDGNEHTLILQLMPDRSEDKSGELNVVTKLISETWLKN